jgi:KaiC/GvpD/RAD55 family RecA-like ATPase
VVYLTTERSVDEIKSRMSHSDADNLIFLDLYTRGIGSRMRGYQFLLQLRDIEVGINDAAYKLGPPVRIIFDSISIPFIYTATSMMVSFLQDLTSKVKREYGSILYTIQEGVHDPRILNLILSFVDGYLQMKFEEGETIERMIRIHHMEGKEYDSSWKVFTLEDGKFKYE